MSVLQKVTLFVYNILMLIVQPFLLGYMLWRARKQPAYLKGWGERFLAQVPKGYKGLATTRRIWVHAVSVGETHAISPLIKKWAEQYPQDVWAISSTTPTGRATAINNFSNLNGVQFFYLPYDLPWLMNRCIRRVNADQLWIVETELWPNLILRAKATGLMTALINARISPRTNLRLRRLRCLSQPVLSALRMIACQTEADSIVFKELGRPVDAITGNLKFDVLLKPELIQLGRYWKASLQANAVLLLASSREGEEVKLLDAMVRAQFFKRLPKVSVWIVPRHPQRCDAVFEVMSLAAARLGVGIPRRRSSLAQGETFDLTNLVLGDSMGEMPAYYSLADLALLGGSWEPFGGQNLIEACAYGCPVWMGPNTWNFQKAAEDALAAQAAVRFDDFAQAIECFLHQDGRLLPQSREHASQFARAHAGATSKSMAMLLS